MSLPLAILGARGRMGGALVRLAPEHDARVVLAIDGPADGALAELRGSGARVLVDFSSPSATSEMARACTAAGVAIVSGTTGLDEAAKHELDAAARAVPVLWEPNMSVGVLVLSEALRATLAMLGDGFDVEIIETHHRLKKDAPSGTALRLADVAREARTGPLVTARAGKDATRRAGEVSVLAVRGGDVVGDHVVHLLGDGERLELVHRATSRDVFARGALRAAAWLADKPAGRYGLRDVLGVGVRR